MAKEKRKGFWGKFDKLMDNLPDYIDEQIKAGDNSVSSIGNNNIVTQSSSSSKSVSIVNGTKIVTESKNGKTKTTINGEEMVTKKEADKLAKTLKTMLGGYGESTFYHKEATKALKNYEKYLGKNK